MTRRLRRLLHETRGAAALEFALVLPVLVILSLMTVEAGRYALLHMKVQNAANVMADLATREKKLSRGQLKRLYRAAETMLKPFDAGPKSAAFVSGVTADAFRNPRVGWQSRGAGGLGAAPKVGPPGQAAKLPPGFPLRQNEAVIVAEVFYRYEAWLLGVIPDKTISHRAYYRPRLGTLSNIN